MKTQENTTEEYCIGLMTGTSLDGVDCALVRFLPIHGFELVATHFIPYSEKLKAELQTVIHQTAHNPGQIQALDNTLGDLYTQSVVDILKKAQLPADKIAVVGCHGQTIAHQPTGPYPFSLQIGNAKLIKQATGIPTIYDFRNEDIKHGGQGAPLAPIFHEWYFAEYAPCAVVNIGGIANVSILTPKQPVKGWDCGPGNTLLDNFYHLHHEGNIDKDGILGRSGQVNHDLLQSLLLDSYFHAQPPKSTGTDYFNLDWLAPFMQDTKLPPQDIQATLTALTAHSIAQDIKQDLKKGDVFVCGGGVHNQFLFELLQQTLGANFQLQSTQAKGLDPDWLEAICFAWLAKQRLHKQKLNLSHVTGSKEPVLLGQLYA